MDENLEELGDAPDSPADTRHSRVLTALSDGVPRPDGSLRITRSAIGDPAVDDLAGDAVRYAGRRLPEVPTEVLMAATAAWDEGNPDPLDAVVAEWAFRTGRPAHPAFGLDAFVAARCELACRLGDDGPLMIRVSPASRWGMGGGEQDAVGEEFVYAADVRGGPEGEP